ncbi:hypothetical protein, partial [Mesorhizobium sp. M1A.F.Ca.IN.020.06.1.1]|uniref:hypothetical protein n=1 Tax=Mesorhizobium sp. M1A.F.Ca.IN.020.06.1.1 TaxID=2496765 RepID=UPI0019D47808
VDGYEFGLFERRDDALEFFLGGDDVHQFAFGIISGLFNFSRKRFRQAAVRAIPGKVTNSFPSVIA